MSARAGNAGIIEKSDRGLRDAWLSIKMPDHGKRELALTGNLSIGRAPDNSLAIDCPGVARYHALIEKRGDSYWLADLNSANGTLVNGLRAAADNRLRDGDNITIGSVLLIFHQPVAQPVRSAVPVAQTAPAAIAPVTDAPAATPQSAGITGKHIIVAIATGIAVTALAALLIVGIDWGGKRQGAKVRILAPQNGTTVREPIKVVVEAENIKNIERVIYQLDGVEFESVEVPPYDITLDPARLINKFPGLAVSNHVLSITVEQSDGQRELQPDTVLLAFDIKPEQTAADTGASAGNRPPDSGTDGAPALDIAMLSQGLASQISQKSGYSFPAEFVEQIRLHTPAYRIDATVNARRHRREIIKAFRDKGLHPLLGFVLAMSRSGFKEATGAELKTGVGLWRVPPKIARGYLSPTENDTAFSNAQRDAEVAAAYLKDLINVFGMDNFMYAIACFGMPLDEAGQIRARLEELTPARANQLDFWRMHKAGVVPRECADRVIAFYAAGVVGENPQAFGLQADRLSSLY